MEYLHCDRLDAKLIGYVDRSEGATLPELCRATDEIYSKVWYRVNTLARVGLLKLIRSRRRIYCFIGDGETD